MVRSLVLWCGFALTGCAAVAHPLVTEDAPSEHLFLFSVESAARDEDSVRLTLRLARPPGSEVVHWGGRTFYNVRYYDVKGRLIHVEEEQWRMFSIDDFNKRGWADTESCVIPPKGAHSFELQLESTKERTKRVVIPGNRL